MSNLRPEYSKVSIPLPDGGKKVVFNYTPAQIVPRRPALLAITVGEKTVTFIATMGNLKTFVAGLKDCVKMIINIER